MGVSQAETADLKQGIEDLANQLSSSVPKGKVLKIAVTDFVDSKGVTNELALYISRRLTTRLSQFPNFRVIERRRLSLVLEELKFSTSDLVEPTKAKRFGKMLGVEAIVVGTVSGLATTVDIDARVIEIETSVLLPGAFVNISKDPDVMQMMDNRSFYEPTPQRKIQSSISKSSKPSKEFQKLKVTLDTLRVISDNSIIIILSFLNQSDKELLLALEADRGGRIRKDDIFVTDDLGNKYIFKGSNSIGPAHFIHIKRGSSGWLTCTPRTEVTASITFAPPRNIEKTGDLFLISIPIHIGRFYIDENNFTRVTQEANFNIYFRDIPIK